MTVTIAREELAKIIDGALSRRRFVNVTAYKLDGTLRTFVCGPAPKPVTADLSAKADAGTLRVYIKPEQRRVWDYVAKQWRILSLEAIVSAKYGDTYAVGE